MTDNLIVTEDLENPNGSGPQVVQPADLLDILEAEAEALHVAHRTGRLPGPSTGIPALDTRLGGCLHPGLHLIHGVPGGGKSAFCLQVARLCGFPAIYVTAEMSPKALLLRLTAQVTETDLTDLISGRLSGAACRALAERAIATFPHLRFVDATAAPAALDLLVGAAQSTNSPFARRLVVVDSIHSWAQKTYPDLAEYDALDTGIADLQRLAATLGGPVLGIAERNRASMESGGLNASAGSRKFEYAAESVLDLQRPPNATPDADGRVPTSIHIHKNRNGAGGGSIQLQFCGKWQRFEEGRYGR